MTHVKLIYNPYLIKSDLFIENVAVTSASPLAFIFGKFMNKWLEPCGAWKGLFIELIEAVGDDSLKIFFVGTAEDFQELNSAPKPKSIELEYLLEEEAQKSAAANQKLQDIVNFLNKPLVTSYEDFFAQIRPALNDILNCKSTINIIAAAKDFSAQDFFFPELLQNTNLKFVIKNFNENLTFTLIETFAA